MKGIWGVSEDFIYLSDTVFSYTALYYGTSNTFLNFTIPFIYSESCQTKDLENPVTMTTRETK